VPNCIKRAETSVVLIVFLWCYLDLWSLHYCSRNYSTWISYQKSYIFISDITNQTKLGGLIVFAPFLIYYYYYSYSPFFPRTMNLSTADLRNYWTEFHETLWSYRYMFPVGPKVFSFVVKGVKVIFWGVQRGWGLL
jgi:hypothetical protein